MPFIDGEYQDGEVRGRLFLCGQSGYGKTTEMIRLCDQCRGGVIFYDHTGNHRLKGAVYVHQPKDLARAIRANLARGRERFRIMYVPMGGDLHEHFHAVCKMAYAVASLTLAVDEIDSYCSSRYGDSRMRKELYDIVHFSRHAPGAQIPNSKRRGMALLFTARIPTSIARGLSSQSSEFRLFHEDDGEYLDFFRRGVLRNKENAEKLRELPKYKFYQVFKDGSAPMKLCGGPRKI